MNPQGSDAQPPPGTTTAPLATDTWSPLRHQIFQQLRQTIWEMESSADIDQVLEILYRGLKELEVPFVGCAVNQVDDSLISLTVRSGTLATKGWVQACPDDPAIDLIARCWRSQQLCYRRDLDHEDLYGERERLQRAAPIRAVVDVPFSHGTLSLTSVAPEAFSARDIAFLEELTALLSDGFRRWEDLEKLEQRAREAEALATAISAVYRGRELGQVLQIIAQESAQLMECNLVQLLLYDAHEKQLVVSAQVGHDWALLRQIRVVPGLGLSGHVFSTGQPYLLDDPEDPIVSPYDPEIQSLLDQATLDRSGPTGRMASVPLWSRGEVIGVLTTGISNKVRDLFDLGLLEQLAAQASLAIERAQHDRELSLSLALQQVRNQILQMEGPQDWQQVAEGCFRELRALVSCFHCSIQLIDPVEGTCSCYFSDGEGVRYSAQYPMPPKLRQVVATGETCYRRTRAAVEEFQDDLGPEVKCVVDAPFWGGTVALSSTLEHAFTAQDLAILERFAQVISEAYRRLEDLKELARVQLLLQQAQKLEAVGQLTAGIAHNFNNLLQANLGNIGLAMDEASPQVQQYLQDAAATTKRGADLIRQLMLFSRTAKTEPYFRPLNLDVVVRNTVSLLRTTIDHRIELEVDLPPDLPLVQADTGQLEQVLLNLYLNARDALEGVERPVLFIRTTAQPICQAGPGEATPREYVRLEVRDNGRGMDSGTRERIFEPFFTTKDVGWGTGLGLATVYGILQRHQGWIECHSEAGQGTLFSCYLPVAAEEVALMNAADTPELPRGTETLLVIDDDELVRRSTARILTKLGYQVLGAPDGLSGLEILEEKKGQISLVLLDLSMPGLSGREVLRRIKARQPKLKVVLFTGYALAQGELEGVMGIAEKPFSTGQLSLMVRRVLDA
ncbi:MAG: GAF domain-containing protein [Candidatus Latescibacteria bacterium]|nr:GAF domain-containing protein [Candidatus Latescibacterota bacterium]